MDTVAECVWERENMEEGVGPKWVDERVGVPV